VYEIHNLEQALAFFRGFETATEFEFFDGFGEWLSRNGGDGPNLTWSVQASRVVVRRAGPDAGREEQLLEFFRIVREFLAVTGDGS
jgi:hypothetical protein